MLNEDLDFDTLMHHKEVIKSLDVISLRLSEQKGETISSDLIERQTDAVDRFSEVIKALPVPEVNISVDQTVLSNSIRELADSIVRDQRAITEAIEKQTDQQKQIVASLKEIAIEVAKKREWVFTHTKDSKGDIISTTAIQIR